MFLYSSESRKLVNLQRTLARKTRILGTCVPASIENLKNTRSLGTLFGSIPILRLCFCGSIESIRKKCKSHNVPFSRKLLLMCIRGYYEKCKIKRYPFWDPPTPILTLCIGASIRIMKTCNVAMRQWAT